MALCLYCFSTLPVVAANPALDRLLAQFPLLQGGGQTADTFAAWSNANYLLHEAYDIGPILKSKTDISSAPAEGELYIAAGKPVLAYWSPYGYTGPVLLMLGKDAKLFGCGNETNRLRGKTLVTTAPTCWPHFLRNPDDGYVAKAALMTVWEQDHSPIAEIQVDIRDQFTSRRRSIEEELSNIWGASASEAWKQGQKPLVTALISDGALDESTLSASHPLNKKVFREITLGLSTLLRQVDSTFIAVCHKRNFPLALRLLRYRLRLLDMSCGLAMWQGQLAHTQPLDEDQRMKLSADLIHQLARAEPKTSLRGYPVSGGLLRDAMVMQADERVSRQYQLHIAYLDAALPYLRTIEPTAMQNITITAQCIAANHTTSLIFTLHNGASEQASGTISFTLNGHAISQTFRIAAGQSNNITFPLPADALPLPEIMLEGALTDGTPMQPTTITITQPTTITQ